MHWLHFMGLKNKNIFIIQLFIPVSEKTPFVDNLGI